MDWTEITVTVSNKDVEQVSDIANLVVPYGIYIEDYTNLEQDVEEIAHIDLIDEELLAKDRTKAKVHMYISCEDNPLEAVSKISEMLKEANIDFQVDSLDCNDEDWLNNWKQYFQPSPVGEKLLIRPTWRKNFDPKGRIVINLDPGLAFGTGTHETTRLCLEVLEKIVKEDTTVLDVGCGSGILGIASLLLGGKSAVGVDIDPMAVKTAKENAVLNSVEDRFTAIEGNFTEKVSGKFDIVVANIVADAIIFLSQGVKAFMKEDSVYIMSGIIDTRVDEVIEEVSKNFEITQKLFLNGWYCLTAKIKE
ncbi:MAG: 50S ribosomal protein L11 methyltransferase [Oscillospiraceae bacterium]|nr:50S ribosomal protein L11 methyltransferase [Oscillospiraceae bacterium]